MKPYYDEDGIQIFHGDCRKIAPAIKAECVLTDPPYGHGSRWQGGTWGAAPMYRDAERWDAERADQHLLERLLSGKQAIVWGGNYWELPPSRCWLAWIKTSPMPTLADFELAWTSFDRPAKAFYEHRNPEGTRLHPTEKPVSLLRWCLGFMPPGIVLDPFMGSGSTLVAAKQLGREAIGIEIEERYCAIAAKRLAQMQLPLEVEGLGRDGGESARIDEPAAPGQDEH